MQLSNYGRLPGNLLLLRGSNGTTDFEPACDPFLRSLSSADTMPQNVRLLPMCSFSRLTRSYSFPASYCHQYARSLTDDDGRQHWGMAEESSETTSPQVMCWSRSKQTKRRWTLSSRKRAHLPKILKDSGEKDVAVGNVRALDPTLPHQLTGTAAHRRHG